MIRYQMTMRVPVMSELHSIFFDEEECIRYLTDAGVLTTRVTCDSCGGKVGRRGKQFHCNSYKGNKAVSIFHGTFFGGAKIKCNAIMHIAYLWLTGCSSTTILMHTGHSEHTVAAYLRHLRQLISETLENDDTLVGGRGVVVQVDETKLGKRKYHRGHRVEGAWVVAGVELTDRRAVFAEVVENRSEATLVDVLRRHVQLGSIIWTDCWKGYSNISGIFGIEHQTVNHSQHFKDPQTEVHTNVIEGTNYALKRAVPPRNRTREHLQSHLHEFVWRRKHEDSLCDAFIKALKDVVYT